MPTMNNEVGANDAACINETLRGEEEERAVNVAGRALLAGSQLPPSWCSRRPSQNEHATSRRPLQRSFGRTTGICFGGAVFIIIFIVDLALIGAITAETGPTAKPREGKDQLRRAKILRTSSSSTAQSVVKAAPLSASRKEVGKDLKKISDGINTDNILYPELWKNDKFTANHDKQNQLSRRAQGFDEEDCTSRGGAVVDDSCQFCYNNDEEVEVCCTTDTPFNNLCEFCLDYFPGAKECTGFSGVYDFDTSEAHYKGCGEYSTGMACYHIECVSIFDCTCSMTWNDDVCGACTIIRDNYIVYDCSAVGGHNTYTAAPTTAAPTSASTYTNHPTAKHTAKPTTQDVFDDEKVCTNSGGTVVDDGCKFCYINNEEEEEVCCTTDTPGYVNLCEFCLDYFPGAKECTGFRSVLNYDTGKLDVRGCGEYSTGIACYHIECGVNDNDCTCSMTWNGDVCGACTLDDNGNNLVYDCSAVGGYTNTAPTTAAPTTVAPTSAPTVAPTSAPTYTNHPTYAPTARPTSSFHKMEREALVAFYNSTGGVNWRWNDGWLEEEDHCSWDRVVCNGGGRVIELNFNSNNMVGPIPTEIGRLTKLARLYLGGNELTGPIPKEIGKLAHLEILRLEENSLTGPMPTEIGKLTKLKSLSLDGNELTGSIPTEIGKLTKLTWLGLYLNELTGRIPTEIGKLTKLSWLGLYLNELTGPIPTEIGRLTKLSWLGLYLNELTGPIPTEIGKLTKLWHLNLGDTSLTGSIPKEIGNLTQLEQLNLGDTSLTGSIPTEIGNLTQLEELNLGDTSLTGSIPKEIGNLTQLEQLFLEGNSLTGTVPTELGYLSKLTELALQNNNLNGTVPVALGNISGLLNLDFNQNEFRSFPFEADWPYLLSLDLRHNQIKQTIPTELNGISQIKRMLLSYNSIYGSIPDQLGSLLRMEELHLDNNHLNGTIPDGILFLSRLRELNLSHNRGRRCFHSSNCDLVSDEVICCDDTETFCTKELQYDFESNMHCVDGIGLWGQIPAGFGNVLYLNILNLSNNSLTGSIPPELGDLPRLESLDLSTNKLNGAIPSDLGGLVEANISLSGNDFGFLDDTGTRITKAPLSLCSVMGFDLANNITWCPPERNALKDFYESAKGQEWTEASGWVDEYNDHCGWHGVRCDNMTEKVDSLTLSNNGLSGRIDENIGYLTSLETLDLHDNDLQGSIPSTIGNLTNLSYARFSFNALTGDVPSNISNLPLTLLHLHGNRMKGSVPIFENKMKGATFIADCGSPSDFDEPVDCPDCTICCNRFGECDNTEASTTQKRLTYGELAGVVVGLVILFYFIVAILTFLYYRIRKTSSRPYASKPVLDAAHNTIGEESVYSFQLTTSLVGWTISIITLGAQAYMFVIFIQAADLDFTDDSVDWVYSWICPRNSEECRDTSDVSKSGWIFFGVLMAVHLAPDMINGLKLLWMFMKGENNSISKESVCFFIGGLSLFSITTLALYASVVYNIAIARSNTELITNAVIVLFISDLDEQLYVLLGVICPRWLDSLNNQMEKDPTQQVHIKPPKERVEEKNIEFAERVSELERREKDSKQHVEYLEQQMKTQSEEFEQRLEQQIRKHSEEFEKRIAKILAGLESKNEGLPVSENVCSTSRSA